MSSPPRPLSTSLSVCTSETPPPLVLTPPIIFTHALRGHLQNNYINTIPDEKRSHMIINVANLRHYQMHKKQKRKHEGKKLHNHYASFSFCKCGSRKAVHILKTCHCLTALPFNISVILFKQSFCS